MAMLRTMPPITIDPATLAEFGRVWRDNGQRLTRTPPYSSGELGRLVDQAVADALAYMLGGIPVVPPNANSLTPAQPDCVELGAVRIIGGVRPQNFDVGYRPDGVRAAFDSKTLNDAKSISKNWQNMVNDLATEATTVHSRFPHAVVAFIVLLPTPCVSRSRLAAIAETLERLGRREGIGDPAHMAEAISIAMWDPSSGIVDPDLPPKTSPLRMELFSELVQTAYVSRYKGLPPHAE